MVDMYFYPSRKNKQVATEHMINKAKNVVVTGAIKLDIMFDRSYTPKDVWKPQEKPKKRIIWAPHHEDKTPAHMYQLDAFYDLYEIMLELAEKYRDSVQIAFKPHPLLKVKLRDKWGEEATAAYYRKWAELENGQLEDGEFFDLFLTSDAMILDCLSFVAEYSVTGRPALFTEGTHSRVLLNDMGKALHSMMYHAKDNLKEEVSRFIEDVVIAGNDPLREERLEFVKNEMMPPNGRTAAENVYQFMCDYITSGGDLPK
jgi:CDP-glycerol glycerophosphotransferase (TagB/SpsB family)